MKTIIIYAHKTSFIQNWIEPLKDFLNYNIIVFHINKLDKEIVPKIDNVELYDITSLSTRRIKKLIVYINPDYVLFLGYRSLMELILLRLCKHLKIKAVYLEHGLFTKDTKKLNSSRLFKDFFKTFNKYSTFLLKYLQLTLTASYKELSYLYKCFIKNNFISNKFDKALFFSEYGFKGLNPVFQYNKEQVVFCGYPLFKDNSSIDYKTSDNKNILYVHQPFILNKQTSINYEEEKTFIIKIKQKLENNYKKFTILLHPRENLAIYKQIYTPNDINVIQKPNDYSVFLDNALVIGHYSTALFYPLFFKIRTLIIDYPSIEIDTLFSNYCQYVSNISEFDVLKKEMNTMKEARELIGPHNTFKNIANILNTI